MRRHRGGTGGTTFRQTNCQLRLKRSGMPSRLSLRRQWILPPLKAFLNCLYHPYAAASLLSPGWRKAERCGREVVGFGRWGVEGGRSVDEREGTADEGRIRAGNTHERGRVRQSKRKLPPLPCRKLSAYTHSAASPASLTHTRSAASAQSLPHAHAPPHPPKNSRTHSPHRISMHSRFWSVLPLSKQFRGRS